VRWEKPLNVTNEVQLVDPSDLKATDMEWRYTEEGEKVINPVEYSLFPLIIYAIVYKFIKSSQFCYAETDLLTCRYG
jgi:hypothetical protein